MTETPLHRRAATPPFQAVVDLPPEPVARAARGRRRPAGRRLLERLREALAA